MVDPDRVNSEEMEDLWSEVDHDGNGAVDYKEFQVITLVCLFFLGGWWWGVGGIHVTWKDILVSKFE